MNKQVTSRDAILNASRNIIFEKGIDSLNMREVALQCGTAVGSIYNYFPSKADLLSATVESVWSEIFRPIMNIRECTTFTEMVSRMFDIIKSGDERFPGFFDLHSMNFSEKEKAKGKTAMITYFGLIETKLADILKNDRSVRRDAFNKVLTEEKFVHYIFNLLILSLLNKDENCEALINLINNCIY